MSTVLSKLAAVMPPEVKEPVVVYLWPECVEAWGHWQQLRTQWRVGPSGSTGLDYAGVRAYLDEEGIEPGEERRELFGLLRACEATALEVWAEIRAKEHPAS